MRLIDADKLRKDIQFVLDTLGEPTKYGLRKAMSIIDKTPTVDTERHGRWIGIDDEPCETYECDKCGYITEDIGCNNGIPNNFKYCPNCGALMEEVEE